MHSPKPNRRLSISFASAGGGRFRHSEPGRPGQVRIRSPWTPEAMLRASRSRVRPAGIVLLPVIAAMVATHAGTAFSGDGAPDVILPRAGLEIDVSGLPQAGFGVGPVVFHIAGSAGYAERLVVSETDFDSWRAGATSLFLEIRDAARTVLNGLRVHAETAGVEVDSVSRMLVAAVASRVSFGAREQSPFEELAGMAGKGRTLASVDDVKFQVLGESAVELTPPSGVGRELRQDIQGYSGFGATVQGIRISREISGRLGWHGSDVDWAGSEISADLALEAIHTGEAMAVELDSVLLLAKVPQLRLLASIELNQDGARRRIAGTITLSETGGDTGSMTGRLDGGVTSQGRLVAGRLAEELVRIGPGDGFSGEFAKLLGRFRREGGMVDASFSWPL